MLQKTLTDQQYIAERGLATVIYLALKLNKPLFLEGEAGVGKTEVAKILARALDTELIRLQCYEGLDVSTPCTNGTMPRRCSICACWKPPAQTARRCKRNCFRASSCWHARCCARSKPAPMVSPPVLLIDEIDRADEEFEAFLLELLSDFQVTIPELGTIRADRPADCGRHQQPHPRSPRRAETPLPVLLDRIPRFREGTARSCAPKRRMSSRCWRSRSPPSFRRCGGWSCSKRRASPKRSTGRRR